MNSDWANRLLEAAAKLLEAREDQMVTGAEWEALQSAVDEGRKASKRTVYYVSTLARYVLVEAADEAEARELGHAALVPLHADVAERLGRRVTIEIRIVRPATGDEIE